MRSDRGACSPISQKGWFWAGESLEMEVRLKICMCTGLVVTDPYTKNGRYLHSTKTLKAMHAWKIVWICSDGTRLVGARQQQPGLHLTFVDLHDKEITTSSACWAPPFCYRRAYGWYVISYHGIVNANDRPMATEYVTRSSTWVAASHLKRQLTSWRSMCRDIQVWIELPKLRVMWLETGMMLTCV